MWRLLFFHLLIISNNTKAQFTDNQLSTIDSLDKLILNPNSHDTSIVGAYLGLTEILYVSNLDTLYPLCNKAIEIGEERLKNDTSDVEVTFTLRKYVSGAYNNLGYVEQVKGNIQNSLRLYEKAKEYLEKIDDKDGLGTYYLSVGFIYGNMGDVGTALEFYHNAYRLYKEVNNIQYLAIVVNNLGSIYEKQNEREEALKYYFESLEYQDVVNDVYTKAATLNNIGLIYKNSDKDTLALEYYFKSIEIYKQIDSKLNLAYGLGNIGQVYDKWGEYDKAIAYFDSSLNISLEIKHSDAISWSYENLGELYLDHGQLKKATPYLEKAYKESLKNSYPVTVRSAAAALRSLYESEKRWDKAYELLTVETAMKDSILSEENTRKTLKSQSRFEFEKKAVADSIQHVNEKAIQHAEIERQYAELKAKKFQQYGLIFILFLVVGITFFVINRLKVTRKQKAQIESQKDELTEIHSELKVRHTEIKDSINYAKRIQDALLSGTMSSRYGLSDYFIHYLPKDVVSGDYYWALEKEGFLYLAVADCTGHGVPGAFLSMLGIAFLNEINAGTKLLEPSEILDQLSEKVVKELGQTGEFDKGKDGMDISLLKIDLKPINNVYTLTWSGANNPLYIIRDNNERKNEGLISENGNYILEEIKADKQGIGYNFNPVSYTNHKIVLNKGEGLILFTDGFADQFGGPNGKKFKYKPFKRMMLDIFDLSSEQQKKSLQEAFESWRGDLEQVDDICTIGLKF